MSTTTKKNIEAKSDFKETLLTPRFYTTNFKEISELDISSNRKEIEAQFKREQRRFRIEELKFGFTALTNAYRERMNEGLSESQENSSRGSQRAGTSMKAIEAVAASSRILNLNVDEGLLLNDLMLTLMQL